MFIMVRARTLLRARHLFPKSLAAGRGTCGTPFPGNHLLRQGTMVSCKVAHYDVLLRKKISVAISDLRVLSCGWDKMQKSKQVFAAAAIKAAGCDLHGAIAAGYTSSELRVGGFTIADFRASGFDWTAIKQACFPVQELKAAGCVFATVRAAGYELPHLKQGGFSIADFRAAGCDWPSIKTAGFTPAEVKASGTGFATAREAGYDLPAIRVGGFTAAEFKAAGCDWPTIKSAGFTALQAKDAGCSLDAARAVGFDVTQLVLGFGFNVIVAAGIDVSSVTLVRQIMHISVAKFARHS
jgi:ribosomal protein L13E